MKYTTLIAVSAAALALAGCGKKEEPAAQSSTGAEVPGAPMADGSVAVSAGQTFANAAAASDAFEIETSKLAAEKASSAKFKTFAEHMIKAHTESTAELKTAAAAANPPITPDPALTAMQRDKLDALKAKSGADFDAAFKTAQVEAHQMTLDTVKAYSAGGDVESLKQLATKMVPVVTAHLNMAKGL
jgi:putative membrane protein